MGTFFHVLSEQYRTEQFFGAERSVLTEQLDPMFPRTLPCIIFRQSYLLIDTNCI